LARSPAAAPLTAASTGFGALRIVSRDILAGTHELIACVPSTLRSAPAQNALPAPVMTMTRTWSAVAKHAQNAPTHPHTHAGSNAFGFLSGRLKRDGPDVIRDFHEDALVRRPSDALHDQSRCPGRRRCTCHETNCVLRRDKAWTSVVNSLAPVQPSGMTERIPPP